MKIKSVIIGFIVCCWSLQARSESLNYAFEFYDGTFNFQLPATAVIDFNDEVSERSVTDFYQHINNSAYNQLIGSLLAYKREHKLDDWIYYQLIRKTAQAISPKASNYQRYTLYKWYLLRKSGYDARLAMADQKLLFYVYSNDDIRDTPFYLKDNRQYVCLNAHDYEKIDFSKHQLTSLLADITEEQAPFTYKITHLPEFKSVAYQEKELEFSYHETDYRFAVKLNPAIESIFANYPVVDFSYYFNIPLSKETYSSLIPLLIKNVKGMSQKKGVDYLMHFTRYAFMYSNDEDNFGKEKRLSPEQTLFNPRSDCDDRVALFYYLVKEIYNLPMIALLYPGHITMAVSFGKPVGETVSYNGISYSICDPTPQATDLRVGQLGSKYQHLSYEVVYQYVPAISY